MFDITSDQQHFIDEFAEQLNISLEPVYKFGQEVCPVQIVAYSSFRDNLALYEFRHILDSDGFGKQYFGIVYRKDLSLEILDEGTSLDEAMDTIKEQRACERADMEEREYYRHRDWEQECFDREHFGGGRCRDENDYFNDMMEEFDA